MSQSLLIVKDLGMATVSHDGSHKVAVVHPRVTQLIRIIDLVDLRSVTLEFSTCGCVSSIYVFAYFQCVSLSDLLPRLLTRGVIDQ